MVPLTRYYAFGWVTDKSGKDVVAGDFFEAGKLPDRRSAWPHLIRMAREAGHEVGDDAKVRLAHLFELPPLPRPPEEDGRPLPAWEIAFDFACDDVKFGSSACGVFNWPEEPKGTVLEAMSIFLIGRLLALRGTEPEYASYSRIISREVKRSTKLPTVY